MGSRAPQPQMESACCRRRPACQMEGGASSSSSSEGRFCANGGLIPSAKRPRETPRDTSIGLTASSPVSSSGQKQCCDAVGANEKFSPIFDGFSRKEIVQLLLQTLGDLGFERTKTTLQEESGVLLESTGVSRLRQAVLNGSWTKALEDTHVLDANGDSLKAIRFFLLERRLLEALGGHLARDASIDEVIAQTADLRQEFLQAAFDAESSERMHRVGEYLSCRTLEALEKASGWTLQENSRAVLWERVLSLLPTHLVVPPRRLSVLLWQAVRYQQLHCLFRDADNDSGTISLLQDYTYKLPPLPTRCIAQLDHHCDEVWFAASSHSGNCIASASKDRTVHLWHFSPPATFSIACTLRGHTEPCSYLAWSPDDQYLLSSSSDSTIRLWKPNSEIAIRVFNKHSEAVTSIAWLHDSRHFVSAGFDRCMYLWNVDGSELHRWEVQSRIQDMGILPDGKRMVVVNSDRNLKVFDVLSRRELFTLPESDAVTSLSVSQLREEVLVNIAQQVSSSQHAPSVRLWDIAARRVTQRYLGHFQSRFIVRSCFGGPREEFVVSGSEDAQVYIWHRHYGSLLEVLAGHSASITSVCWLNSCSYGCSPTTWLVSASDDHTLRVWSSSMSIEEHRVEAVDADTEADDMNGPAEPESEAVPEPLGLEDITESPNVLRRRTSHGVEHASDTTHADEEVLG